MNKQQRKQFRLGVLMAITSKLGEAFTIIYGLHKEICNEETTVEDMIAELDCLLEFGGEEGVGPILCSVDEEEVEEYEKDEYYEEEDE